MRKSLCNYSNAYKLVKATITVVNTAAAGSDASNVSKKVIFKVWLHLINI